MSVEDLYACGLLLPKSSLGTAEITSMSRESITRQMSVQSDVTSIVRGGCGYQISKYFPRSKEVNQILASTE
jgi:hypothetical protein